MNVVDSSGWLEYLADGPNADFFSKPIHQVNRLIVPSLSLFEVFKRLLMQVGEDAALQGISIMQQGNIIDLDQVIAINAAKLSADLKIPMADSIMLATTRQHDAMLWTQDSDFDGLENVHYVKRAR
jgi:predicted nucleic acid-binding protein